MATLCRAQQQIDVERRRALSIRIRCLMLKNLSIENSYQKLSLDFLKFIEDGGERSNL